MRKSGCRLEEKTQDRLAEFFVGGVTARSAADLVGVNRKTAAYFIGFVSSSPNNWRTPSPSKAHRGE
jgi:transposase-like protein